MRERERERESYKSLDKQKRAKRMKEKKCKRDKKDCQDPSEYGNNSWDLIKLSHLYTQEKRSTMNEL